MRPMTADQAAPACRRPPKAARAAPRDLYSRFIPREELSSFAVVVVRRRLRRRRAAARRSARGRGAGRSGRAARAAAARGAPVGLPGRLPRRPGRARRLQAELRQPDDDAGRRARPLGRRAARRAPAGDGARPRRDGDGAGPPGAAQRAGRRGPNASTQVAEQALDALLLSARHIVLRVHPDDHALIAGGSAEAIAARGARLVADAQVARGGCRVESDIGLVDATIDERWRRARRVARQRPAVARRRAADAACRSSDAKDPDDG